jgi:superfamily II DNA or RNA helicase
MIELRPYQNDFVSGVARGFHAGHMRQLGVLPTGGGKTICFAHIAQRFHEKRSERTLVLAHREELIEQAADKIHTATGLTASVEKAERHADRAAPVVVASIQTMQGNRLATWAKDHFGLVVCDEAHHVLADQWQNTLGHFDSRVLGVTATPDRGDKKNLAVYFQNLAYECNLLDLIGKGFLSPIQVKSVPLKIDLNAVKQTAGDYDSNQLDAAITPYLKEIARYLATECPERKKIVVFLPLIQTSQRFVDECIAAGIDARHVDGQSPNRKEILSDFGDGKFRLLANAMLLTEGWDEPGVDCLLVLRPTKSRGLFAQMVGRGTRLCAGKTNLLLLDFLWLHERHDLARPASLVARTKEEEKAITEAILSSEEKDLGEAVEDAENEREAALIRQIAENASKRERFMPIEQVGALLKDRKIMDYSPVFGWEKQPVTQGQKTVLDRFGLKCTTKGEASMVMNRLFDRSKDKLATVKQLMWLVRFKHPSPETCTAKEAKIFLDERFSKKA